MALAAAVDGDEELVVALLDYYKFFDSFEPRFYARFLRDMGLDDQFVDLFLNLNTRAEKRVKIGTVLSEPFGTFNALGQGDPVTLMVALLYVSVQFRMLEDRCGDVAKSAMVDDRNLTGKSIVIEPALREIQAFDIAAGHVTQTSKLALMATTKRAKLWAQGLEIDGTKPKIVDRAMLVGDTITAVRRGNMELASRRTAHALAGVNRILATNTAQKVKQRAAAAVAIPRALACTSWARPAA